MSTRCNVLLKDGHEQLWFYRHSDGYPSVTGESLRRFMRWVIDGRLRDNVSQAGGWLILLGAVEYQTLSATLFPQGTIESYKQDRNAVADAVRAFVPNDWKCGAYEPTCGQHRHIEFLYTIDLESKSMTCASVRGFDEKAKPIVVATVDRSNIDQPLPAPVRD